MVMTTPPANKTRAIVLPALLAMGWIGILFLESTRPPAGFLGLIPQLDKVAHFGAFGILSFLVCSLSLKLKPRTSIPVFSLPLLVVTLCGVTNEIIQMFVPGRVAGIPDVLADMAGAIFSILLVNRMGMGGKARSGDKWWGIF